MKKTFWVTTRILSFVWFYLIWKLLIWFVYLVLDNVVYMYPEKYDPGVLYIDSTFSVKYEMNNQSRIIINFT